MLTIGNGRAAPAEDDLAAIARDAYVFTFPLYEMYRIRFLAECSPFNPHHATPNTFRHRRQPADANSRAVTTPNADTLYSSAFLDLSPGPLLLQVPATADRYYSLAFMDFYTNNFAYVGTRTTGNGAGRYLIVGPGWRGAAPRDTAVIHAPTNAVWLLGRFLVDGPQGLAAAHRAQDGLRLAPLDRTQAAPSSCRGPAVEAADPWNYFAVVDYALTENPPPARDAGMLARIAAIGVGPGHQFDAARRDARAQQAILAGIAQAKAQIATAPMRGKIVNGWAYPPPGVGDAGADYLLRAAVALKGLAALTASEAIYLSYVGRPLVGEHRYRLHFAAGEEPPTRAFWSLSAYEIMPDKRRFFAANPMARYSIGDKTPGVKRNADGSLDILIEHESPGVAQESNWLPAPNGPFAISLRAYWPEAPLLADAYAPPSVESLP
ncbi:MAG TPA: DUF1254 domain-containing protein [Stellaceae bacterium]|nr:DUF1254 domain-containing protein [Stellaceae bacterium]